MSLNASDDVAGEDVAWLCDGDWGSGVWNALSANRAGWTKVSTCTCMLYIIPLPPLKDFNTPLSFVKLRSPIAYKCVQ